MIGTSARETADSPFGSALDGVYRSLGLSRAEHVASGTKRAMARAAVRNSGEYRRLLDTDESALAALITELTVGETYFLRESGQFDFIRREVLPSLAGGISDRGITAWSAGCATGEEAYSLAMIAQEANPPLRVRVLGTDVAQSRLAIARQATYGEWSLRGVPEETVHRYFQRRGRKVKVAPLLRSMVEFRSLNLASTDWSRSGIAPRSMDLICCRNVLIYFDADTVARVASKLIESLSDNGWLFLGASDPGLADLVACEVVVTGSGLAYRRKGKGTRGSTAFPRPVDSMFSASPSRVPASVDRTDDDYAAFPAWSPPNAESLPLCGATRADRRDPDIDTRAATALVARARAEYMRADYTRAIDLARECVTRDTHDAEGWILLVRALANLGLNEEAGLACAAGLDLNRSSAELTCIHAMLLRQSGRNAEALAALRCALYLDRQFAVAHLAMGDVLSVMGDRSGARQSFRNAERLLRDGSDERMVPGSDGLDAGRLLAVVRMQLGLLDRPSCQ
ncbi:MAG TPA: CheR family methyltransferase [Gemmatimonadaceae bacterium]|nr:CheR family methyltransferase [Gemmatimonadaceae bacterium]